MKKKIFLFLATMLAIATYASAQNNWVGIPSTPTIVTNFLIKGDTIFGFEYGTNHRGYYSTNLGYSWVEFFHPVTYVHSEILFKNKIYISGPEGVYYSSDGISWLPSLTSLEIWVLSANKNWLYAFGWDTTTYQTISARTTGDTPWINMNIVNPFSSIFFEVSFTMGDTVVAIESSPEVGIDDNRYESHDAGNSWSFVGTMPIYSYAATSSDNSQYVIVGNYTTSQTIDPWAKCYGKYNFSGNTGLYTGTCFYKGHNYITAGYYNVPIVNSGAIILDGDTTLSYYFPYNWLLGITSGENLCIAWGADNIWMLDETTGISTLPSEKKFLIYPNPTTGILNIGSLKNNMEIQIYNTNGKSIGKYCLKEGSNWISLKGLSSGVYFIRSSDGNYNNKIIKN